MTSVARLHSSIRYRWSTILRAGDGTYCTWLCL